MCGLRYFNLQMNLTIGLGRQRFKIGSPVHDNLRQELLFSFSDQETAGLRNIFQIGNSQCSTLALKQHSNSVSFRFQVWNPIPIPIPDTDTDTLLSILRLSNSESACFLVPSHIYQTQTPQFSFHRSPDSCLHRTLLLRLVNLNGAPPLVAPLTFIYSPHRTAEIVPRGLLWLLFPFC